MKRLFRDSMVNKLLLIVIAVFLLASVFGVVGAFSLPSEIEETVAQVSYHHEGKFDYLAYLKPSYLFGPEPQEPSPPPPSLKYPTEIIDRFDMTFTYRFVPDEPVVRTSGEVEVIAIVKRPDVEPEEITLVDKTTQTGDFTVNFTLDMTDDISGGDITITAQVYTTVETDTGLIFESFTQRLAMRTKGQLLEVDGDLTHTETGFVDELNYEQQGAFNYKVRLKPDSPFGAITLKPPSVTPPPPAPPKTVRPGELLFSKLVDGMDVTFSYRFESDKPVTELSQEVAINAILENPGVWSRTFVLVPPTYKSEDFSLTFPLDINYFTEMLEAIRAETGVPAEAYNLTIKADVHTVAQTDFGAIDEVFSQTLSTTLGGGTLEWSEELVSFKPGAIETTKLIPNPNRYLGLSLTGVRILSAVMLAIFALLFAYLVWLNSKFKPVAVSPIEKEIRLARKKFGERMAEATSQTPIEGEKIISIGSMEDLSKVADELGKPIIHQAPTTPEEAHAYYVFDGSTRYQYVLACGEE